MLFFISGTALWPQARNMEPVSDKHPIPGDPKPLVRAAKASEGLVTMARRVS